MKLALVLVMMISSALADYKSEEAAIENFYKTEFANSKNYPPTPPGQAPTGLLKGFADRLLKNPKELKYFLVNAHQARFMQKFQGDRAYGIFWENKFGGKKLGAKELNKIGAMIGEEVLADKDLAAQKSAISSFSESEKYFNKIMKAIESKNIK